jgi:hypothetical protein
MTMFTSIVNQFIYRPDMTSAPEGFTPTDLGLDFESVSLRTADGLTLSAWYLPSPCPKHSLLYCHGNGGDIRDWVRAAAPFVKEGISVLVFDYRGYGGSEGIPSERGLSVNGETAWQWLVTRSEKEEIPTSILGKSLGTSVAAHIAAQYQPTGLVLDSAFTSMQAVITNLVPWLPGFTVPKLHDSLSRVPQIECPTLVIHGDRDQLVPLVQGQRVYQALEGPKAMRIVRGAGHNDIDLFSSYHEWVLGFLMDPRLFIAGRDPI